MNETNRSLGPSIGDTIDFVKELFEGRVDKGGEPYYNHCEQVMMGLPEWASDDDKHAALLHDVVEDTDVTLDDLRARGYSERTVWLVGKLTHDKDNVEYLDYIVSIRDTRDAGLIAIKKSDLNSTTDPERVARLPDGFAYLMKRYAKAKTILG